MSELQIKNKSERDLVKQLWSNLSSTNIAQKTFLGSNRIRTHDLRDTDTICSTNWAMKTHRKQVRYEFNLYPLYEENDVKCIW